MIEIGLCGYSSVHQTAFDIRRPMGSPDYVLLLIKTESYYEENEVIHDLPANTAILYNKNTYVHYGSRKPNYCNDWIHFTLDGEDLVFLLSLDIPFNTPITLPHLNQLSEFVHLIVLNKHSKQPFGKQTMDATMKALLFSVASQKIIATDSIMTHKNYELLNQLRMAIHNSPDKKWTIKTMANTVHMSPSYMQHQYKALFGITCIQECIKARINRACSYLRTTDMAIQMVALLCGYNNETHFMRQFKNSKHMTPSEYRDRYQSW
ncbi:AraC family transcriptional regulator [Lachnospiraceae bacterium OttesenSCG-928-D06]|nr:AraC family transcriptional regulator [Lachnospiraceae bacterium OttesenSCG-928-D06]